MSNVIELQQPEKPIITLDPVRESLRELEGWCRRKIDVTESFNDACEAIARKANIEPAVLKSYVTARVKDQMAKKEKHTEQLSLLFESLK